MINKENEPKNIFKVHKWKKEFTQLRNALKKEDIILRLVNQNKRTLPTQVISLTHENSYSEFEIQFSHHDNSLHIAEIYGLYEEKFKPFFPLVFECIKSACRNNDIELIIAASIYKSTNELLNYGFVVASELPGEEYPLSIIVNLSIPNAKNFKHNQVYFIELKENVVKEKMEFCDHYRETIGIFANSHDLFEIKATYYNYKGCITSFYYDGFEGRILANYEHPITVKLTNYDWFKPIEYAVFKLNNIEELETCFYQCLKISNSKVALKNLLNPPKTHFESYLKRNNMFSMVLLNCSFELLQTVMDYRQIEKLSQTIEPNHSMVKYEKIQYFVLFEKHFVFDLNNNRAEMFDTHKEASSFFSNKCMEFEQEKYRIIMNNIYEAVEEVNSKNNEILISEEKYKEKAII